MIAIAPDGSPVKGASVWISHVSAPAVLQGVTDDKGQFVIPAKRLRHGGWHSIIVIWQDPKGNVHLGQNFDHDPKFPLTVRLTKR